MKSLPAFDGFKPDVIEFYKQLKNNNSKEWFDANRSVYENTVKFPTQSFVLEMASAFGQTGLPYMADIKRSLFRINRDIRFSKNKDPYKTNLGMYFPYKVEAGVKKPVESCGIYLHIEPTEFFIAGGIHMPEPQQLKSIRTKIYKDWEEFEDIVTDKQFLKEFPGKWEGDKLKKAPAGFPSDHPSVEWLKQKEFTVYIELKEKDIQSRKIIDTLLQKAKALVPYNDFLQDAMYGNY
jgi:uncharacterized protein (TIGR02453 family)